MASASGIRIRLTRPGMWLMGVLCVLLLMAMNYRNNANYLLFAVMSACSLIAALEARRNLRGIEISSEPSRPVFADQRPTVLLRLQIPDGRPRSLLRLAIDDEDMILLEAEDGTHADILLSPRPRGVHHITTCRISSNHPFGLFTVSRELPCAVELIVYPSAIGERPLPGGDSEGDQHGEAQDFAGHRRYQPGDAPQHIDWKVQARSNRTVVKRFGSSSEHLHHQLDLASLAELDLERALSQLSRWVCLAEEQHEPYGLDLHPATAAVACGPAHQQRCLETLARHGIAEPTDSDRSAS